MGTDDANLVLECAVQAPSVHNTQPWRLVAAEDRIEVHADRSRSLPFLDPTGRQLHVSCGAAIEFGYLAARDAGRACTIELFPDPAVPDLLATLSLGQAEPATDEERRLAEAIARRYTDRGAYEDRAVPPDVLIDCQRLAAALGVWVRILDTSTERTIVAAIVADAEAAEAADPRYAEELAKWRSSDVQPEGMPAAATNPEWPADRVSDVPLRDFAGHNVHRHPGGEDAAPPRVERDTLALIGTPEDDPTSWLRAGRALARILLRSASDGISAQPLGQAIDLASGRQRLRRELGIVGEPQFLFRLGYGRERPHTGRRSPGIFAPQS